MTTTDSEKVQNYFDHTVKEFDEFYREEKSALRSWVDQTLRKSMQLRFDRTFDLCTPMKGKSLLDLGCGTGRYSVRAAQMGAARVLGIDFADQMLSQAREIAKRAGVNPNCEFRQGDAGQLGLKESFDYSIAIGFFDYVGEPALVLKDGLARTHIRFVASFPSKWNLWGPQRAIRYKIKGCPLFFYSKTELSRLASQFPDFSFQTIPLGRDFLCVWERNS